MTCDNHKIYSLPTIDFIAGAVQNLVFYVYENQDGVPYDLTNCTAQFAVSEYNNRNGEPVISKAMRVDAAENKLSVQLTSYETVKMAGKYIYQISIKLDAMSIEADIPGQGILDVSVNIDKNVILQAGG